MLLGLKLHKRKGSIAEDTSTALMIKEVSQQIPSALLSLSAPNKAG